MRRHTIRDAAGADETSWRRLWALYNDFHEQRVPEPVTDATWRRILDPADASTTVSPAPTTSCAIR